MQLQDTLKPQENSSFNPTSKQVSKFRLTHFGHSTMTQQSPGDRRIQSLFPAALFSLLLLGASKLVLEGLKNRGSRVSGLYKDRNGSQKEAVIVLPEDRMKEGCNLFEGEWVWDNVTNPLYTEESCPYLVKQTTCLRNGRPDFVYQNWRWKPHACNLPRWKDTAPSGFLFFLQTTQVSKFG